MTTLLLVPYLPGTSERMLAALGERVARAGRAGLPPRRPEGRAGPAALPEDRGSGPMIDSHTHLFLCERPEAEVVAAALEAGVGRMLNVGLGEDSNEVAIAGAERHEGVFATVGLPPDLGGRVRRRGGRGDRPARGAREGAGDRRDRDRLLPRVGEPGRPAPRLRGADRDRPRPRPADRHPRPRPRRRDDRDRRGLRDPRRAGREAPSSCTAFSLPGGWTTRSSAAGTAPSPASSPSPSPTPCARRRRSCPTSSSWSRPTLPISPRSRCGASRTSPPTSSPRRRSSPRLRGVAYEELERTVEANARAVFGW